MSPLSSSGRPSGSTRRPSISSPTGICSRLPVRLTVSPSTILSHSPKSTAPTLSSSRLRASPVTPCGRSSISRAMQLSRPCTRAIPSATESTVPTSERSALPVSRPSIRCRRIEEISSGLISMLVRVSLLLRNSLEARFSRRGSPLRRLRDLPAQLLEPVEDARVEDHVAHLQLQAADDRGVDLALQLDRLPGLTLDLGADGLDHGAVELDGAGHGDAEALVLLRPELVEAPADREQGRHPVLLSEQLEEVDELGLGAVDRARDPVPLLRGREVGAEEEDLQVPVAVELVGNLAELLV